MFSLSSPDDRTHTKVWNHCVFALSIPSVLTLYIYHICTVRLRSHRIRCCDENTAFPFHFQRGSLWSICGCRRLCVFGWATFTAHLSNPWGLARLNFCTTWLTQDGSCYVDYVRKRSWRLSTQYSIWCEFSLIFNVCCHRHCLYSVTV